MKNRKYYRLISERNGKEVTTAWYSLDVIQQIKVDLLRAGYPIKGYESAESINGNEMFNIKRHENTN